MIAKYPRLGFVLLLLVGLGHLLLYLMPFEDSFISYRYARNLADGLGLVYNAGERVEGCTSPGWVALLAGFAELGAAIPSTGLWLSLLASLGLLAMTVLLARRCLPELGPWWAIGAGLLVAAQGTFAYYGMSGMETALFAVLVTVAAYAASRAGRRSAIVAGVLLAVSGAVRPEAPLYVLLIAIAIARSGAEGRRDALALVTAFALLFVPYFAWRWHYFGYLLPNTFYAKARVGGAGILTGIEQVEEFMTLQLFWLAPVGFALLRSRRSERWWWIGVGLLGGAAANVILIGGDAFMFFRVFLPAVPVGCVAIIGAVHELVQRLGRRRDWSAERTSESAAAAVVLLALATFGAAWVPRETLISEHDTTHRKTIVGVDRINADYFEVGRWLKRSFPTNTTIATNAAGIVPYESGLPTIDMLGLNDAHIAHREVSGAGAVGHQKHDAAYVLSRRPEVILPALPTLSPRKLGPQELLAEVQSWSGMLPGERELLAQPALVDDYLLVTVPVKQDGWLTLYLRKDAPKPPELH